MYIKEVYPDKAQYLKGETVHIIVSLHRPLSDGQFLLAEIWFNNYIEDTININTDGGTMYYLCLGEYYDNFKGYGVVVRLVEQDITVETGSTAFDVVENHNLAIRYGFLSDFYEHEKGDLSDVDTLNKYHINYVQFYDWMYRHEKLVPDTDKFQDLMGRTLDLEVICEKIEACHCKNMQAIAYGAVYAASEEFYKEHSSWGLLSGTGEVYDFIGKLKIMSLSEDIPWHRHIIQEYRNAITECDFDGIHFDTYGAPKWGKTKYKGISCEEYLEEQFPVLINNTRECLDNLGRQISLIFNNVGNWPVDSVAQSGQDAMYIEVWDPYNSFDDISQIICNAKQLSNNKPVVLAAYIKPFLKEERERAEASALLTMAAIVSNGAYHLAVGEKDCILMQAYYVDHYKMSASFTSVLKKYYDFAVRYSHLFYDSSLRNVSKTHCFGDNYEYRAMNFKCSVNGEEDSVYAIIRENKNMKLISIINLYGNDGNWNVGKNRPHEVKNLIFEISILKNIRSIYAISPDFKDCQPFDLEHYTFAKDGKKFLTFTLQSLLYWSSIVIEF